jgi:hypothetical protein
VLEERLLVGRQLVEVAQIRVEGRPRREVDGGEEQDVDQRLEVQEPVLVTLLVVAVYWFSVNRTAMG